MNWITRAWQGEERLWKVFWIYGVLLGLLLHAASTSVLYFFGALVQLLPLGVETVYVIWINVAHWQCAFNTNWKFWGYTVRVVTAVSLIMSSGSETYDSELVFIQYFKATMECDTVSSAGSTSGDLNALRKACMQKHLNKDVRHFSWSETIDNMVRNYR